MTMSSISCTTTHIPHTSVASSADQAIGPDHAATAKSACARALPSSKEPAQEGSCQERARAQEIYAGHAGLSTALSKYRGIIEVGVPVEAFPNGKYDPESDVLRKDVSDRLYRELHCHSLVFAVIYYHFGIDCSSFSRVNVNLNAGTRTKACPSGDGSLERELLGNALAKFVLKFCLELCRLGHHWSIENPTSSFLWQLAGFRKLARMKGVHKVRFCQCEYGLHFPDDPKTFCRKDTIILTNINELESLSIMCSGNHQHTRAIGSVKTSKGWVSRTKLAGQYPKKLCSSWAQAIALSCPCSAPPGL